MNDIFILGRLVAVSCLDSVDGGYENGSASYLGKLGSLTSADLYTRTVAFLSHFTLLALSFLFPPCFCVFFFAAGAVKCRRVWHQVASHQANYRIPCHNLSTSWLLRA